MVLVSTIMHLIRLRWVEKRDPVSREWALVQFHDLPALEAAQVALAIDRHYGADAGQRFLLEAESYLRDPAAWRSWARKFHKKAA